MRRISGSQGVGRPRSRDAPQGGSADLWNLAALDQALAQKAQGERGGGGQTHTRSSGQEGRRARGVVARPARKRSRPVSRGALRGVRGGSWGQSLHGYDEPEDIWSLRGRRLAAQKKSPVATERDEQIRGLWRWLASH